jgi:2-polyprenyl-3-methyl-5-hydroxy-6-metoxy-1,4-benzoquinol methylase
VTHDDLVSEQIEYYEQRAAEYEDLYFRRGAYDLGAERNAAWKAETDAAERALEEFAATGNVLEIACGTGLLTRFLVGTATTLTAVDAASATIELNRGRYAADHVTYVLADVFSWEPAGGQRFDAIVFGFFLSHVPPERFEPFWNRLRGWLTPGGRVFFVDDVAARGGTYFGDVVEGRSGYAHRRTLVDGRTFTIVKRFYDPAQLVGMLDDLGWNATVGTTGAEFLIGIATSRDDARSSP